MGLLRSGYERLPKAAQNALAPLRALWRSWNEQRWQASADAWMVEGICEEAPLRIGYAGTEPHMEALKKTAFGGCGVSRPLGRIPWAEIDSAFEAAKPAMAVYQVPPYSAKHFRSFWELKAPLWVRYDLELPKDVSALRKVGKFGSIARRAERAGLRARVTKGEAEFNDFYRRLYVPHARSRYGASAVIHAYDDMKRVLPKAEIIQAVEADGRVVAAAFVNYADPLPLFWNIGVSDEDQARLGGLSLTDVLLYFKIARAIELGYRAVSMGFSRPFLEDGVVRYKLERGAAPTSIIYEPSGYLYFHILEPGSAVRDFFEANPLLAYVDGRLRPLFFTPHCPLPAWETREPAFYVWPDAA